MCSVANFCRGQDPDNPRVGKIASAEGKKSFTSRGSGGNVVSPARSERSPQSRRDVEHFMVKWSTFWDLVNLIFCNNQICAHYNNTSFFHHNANCRLHRELRELNSMMM